MSKINDDLMRVRLSVPEPTWVDVPYWKFMWPLPPITFFDCGSFDSEVTIKTESLERKKFYEEGVVYSAWTYDGTTPLFPVPI